jgi:hypothetical protein
MDLTSSTLQSNVKTTRSSAQLSIQEVDFALTDAIDKNDLRSALHYLQSGAKPLARATQILQYLA